MFSKKDRSESRQNLTEHDSMRSRTSYMSDSEGITNVLTPIERKYLLHIQRGDIATSLKIIDDYQDKPEEFDKNCLDALGRSAIVIAIENENLDLLDALLEKNVEPKEALLHAISEEYVEGVDTILEFEESRRQPGMPYSWEMVSHDSSKFTKDITPVVMAAHRNNYEILKLLLDRGATLPVPHDIRCGCDECVSATDEDSLRHSLARINSYRALSSAALVALSSKDPFLTLFELSYELQHLTNAEYEFREEYEALNNSVMQSASELLNQVRTQQELSTIVNYDPDGLSKVKNKKFSLQRIKLAITDSQKDFVAHPNIQKLVGALFYDGLADFRRKKPTEQILTVFKIACMFPIISLSYIINPSSEKGKFLKKPFVKFLCHCSSYMFFLMLLALQSQRIEYQLIELFGNDWLRGLLEDWKLRERGSIPGIVEFLIIIYVFGFMWHEVKTLWRDGFLKFIKDLWNIVDFIKLNFFITWILLRVTSWIIVHRQLWVYDEWPWYPREKWHAFDPMLVSEGCFGAAMIFSFLKLISYFNVNPHLGPLQISLERMIFDILKFFFLYTLVLFAFGCGLNKLMWYYAKKDMEICYHLPSGLPDYNDNQHSCIIWRRFINLFETSQSLFWASFGLISLESFDLNGIGEYTRFWALLMFGSYSVVNVIVLLNLLIAMMSNSYQIISEKSDVEWKFARTKLYLNYFKDGATVPAPFNLIPTPQTFRGICNLFKLEEPCHLKKKAKRIERQNYQHVMRLLVRRKVTENQRQTDERAINEDDINEVKQSVSTFRYDLINVFSTNGMNTSMTSNEDPLVVSKKGRVLERKLLKGFNIELIEGILQETVKRSGSKNVFSNLAMAFKKQKQSDTDQISTASFHGRNQIGSSRISLERAQSSIRRRIKVENEDLLGSMNPDEIAEYNPNLRDCTDATRVAYAKFKVHTKRRDKKKSDVEANAEECAQNGDVKNQERESRKLKSTVSFEDEVKESKIVSRIGKNEEAQLINDEISDSAHKTRTEEAKDEKSSEGEVDEETHDLTTKTNDEKLHAACDSVKILNEHPEGTAVQPDQTLQLLDESVKKLDSEKITKEVKTIKDTSKLEQDQAEQTPEAAKVAYERPTSDSEIIKPLSTYETAKPVSKAPKQHETDKFIEKPAKELLETQPETDKTDLEKSVPKVIIKSPTLTAHAEPVEQSGFSDSSMKQKTEKLEVESPAISTGLKKKDTKPAIQSPRRLSVSPLPEDASGKSLVSGNIITGWF